MKNNEIAEYLNTLGQKSDLVVRLLEFNQIVGLGWDAPSNAIVHFTFVLPMITHSHLVEACIAQYNNTSRFVPEAFRLRARVGCWTIDAPILRANPKLDTSTSFQVTAASLVELGTSIERDRTLIGIVGGNADSIRYGVVGVKFYDPEIDVLYADDCYQLKRVYDHVIILTDLNELRNMIGVAWNLKDEDHLVITVAAHQAVCSYYPDGSMAYSTHHQCELSIGDSDDALTAYAPQASIKHLGCGVDKGKFRFAVGSLRTLWQQVSSAVRSKWGQLSPYEVVDLNFQDDVMIVTCCGQAFRVQGDRL